MTMIGQNGKDSLDKILLLDSPFNISSLKGREDQYQKIITFDSESHRILSENNIPHQISDHYVDQNELNFLQKKSYELSKWYNQKEIQTLVEYEGINLGRLVHVEFMDFIVGFLKKFQEIAKIVPQHRNFEFVVSSGLFDTAKIFVDCQSLQQDKIVQQSENVKYSYRIGGMSFSITTSKKSYLKLKSITEAFFQKLFHFDMPKNKNKHVLLVEFDPTKYKTLFFASKMNSQNIMLYNRRWPTIWNFESFNIIKKSDCRIPNVSTLRDTDSLDVIRKEQNRIKKNIQVMMEGTNLESFFSIDSKSFWIPLRPFFESLIRHKMNEAINEIELAKKLFVNYQIGSILISSEIGFTEQIVMNLARKNQVPVIMMQHGVAYETEGAFERNNLLGYFPNFSDFMITWGNTTKEYLERCGVIPNKIKALGSTLYDDLFDKTLSKESTILLATSPPMKDLINDNLVATNESYRLAIEKICRIVTGLNQKLVIKLHPSLVDFDIESLTKQISNDILVVRSGSIVPFIENCKLMLTFDLSTTILEAQILKKPVISISLKDYGFGESEIFRTNACISADIEELEQILNKILTDDNYRNNIIKNGDSFVDGYLSNKGKSTKEILAFLKQF